jgi:hypothetical protein
LLQRRRREGGKDGNDTGRCPRTVRFGAGGVSSTTGAKLPESQWSGLVLSWPRRTARDSSRSSAQEASPLRGRGAGTTTTPSFRWLSMSGCPASVPMAAGCSCGEMTCSEGTRWKGSGKRFCEWAGRNHLVSYTPLHSSSSVLNATRRTSPRVHQSTRLVLLSCSCSSHNRHNSSGTR